LLCVVRSLAQSLQPWKAGTLASGIGSKGGSHTGIGVSSKSSAAPVDADDDEGVTCDTPSESAVINTWACCQHTSMQGASSQTEQHQELHLARFRRMMLSSWLCLCDALVMVMARVSVGSHSFRYTSVILPHTSALLGFMCNKKHLSTPRCLAHKQQLLAHGAM
jgi:hypothetical protein